MRLRCYFVKVDVPAFACNRTRKTGTLIFTNSTSVWCIRNTLYREEKKLELFLGRRLRPSPPQHWRRQLWGTGARVPWNLRLDTNLAISIHVSLQWAAVVNTSTSHFFHMLLYTSVTLVFSWLFLRRNFCDFCRISQTRTPCPLWVKILATPLLSSSLPGRGGGTGYGAFGVFATFRLLDPPLNAVVTVSAENNVTITITRYQRSKTS